MTSREKSKKENLRGPLTCENFRLRLLQVGYYSLLFFILRKFEKEAKNITF